MKRKFTFVTGAVFTLMFFPINAFAYSNWGQEAMAFSLIDVFFDVLGFSVAVLALCFGLEMLRKLTGKLKVTWIYCIISILIFLILQIMTLVSAFYNIDFSGIFSILKFIMGLFFLFSVFAARSMVQEIVRNKSLRRNNDSLTIPSIEIETSIEDETKESGI